MVASLISGMSSPPPPGFFSELKIALRNISLITGSGHSWRGKGMFTTHFVSRARCNMG